MTNNKKLLVLTIMSSFGCSFASEFMAIIPQYSDVEQLDHKYEVGEPVEPTPEPPTEPTYRTVQFIDVSTSAKAGYAIDTNGEAWSIGGGANGELALGGVMRASTWTKSGLSDVKEIAGGADFVIALTNSGDVYVSGRNQAGQLGLNNGNTNVSNWTKTSLSGIKDIDASDNASYAIDSSNNLWVTGRNVYGQLGLGHENDISTWTKTTLSNAKTIYAGSANAFIVDNANDLWFAGTGGNGALGTNNGSDVDTWTKSTMSNVKMVTSAEDWTLLITNDNRLWTTGEDRTSGEQNWTWVDTGYNFNYVDLKYKHAVAIDGSGQLWVRGANETGQLGLGNKIDKSTWTTSPQTNVSKAVTGYQFTYSFTDSSELYGSGKNSDGQLNTGNLLDRRSWVKSNEVLEEVTEE